PGRPLVLNGLGTALIARGDVEDAIKAFRASRDAAPPGSSLHARATLNLGSLLTDKVGSGERAGRESFTLSVEELSALIAELTGKPSRRRRHARGRQRAEDDPHLDEGIELLREAISTMPSVRSAAYAHLGLALRKRYDATGKPRALAQALRIMRDSVAASAPR